MPYDPSFTPPPTPEQEAEEEAKAWLDVSLDFDHRPPSLTDIRDNDPPKGVPRKTWVKVWAAWWRGLRRDTPTVAGLYALAETVVELRHAVEELTETVRDSRADNSGPY